LLGEAEIFEQRTFFDGEWKHVWDFMLLIGGEDLIESEDYIWGEGEFLRLTQGIIFFLILWFVEFILVS
jgi:hypothetical protein